MFWCGLTRGPPISCCRTDPECLGQKSPSVFRRWMAQLGLKCYFQKFHSLCPHQTSKSVLSHFESRFSIILCKSYHQSKTSTRILLFYPEENCLCRNFHWGSRALHNLISNPHYSHHCILFSLFAIFPSHASSHFQNSLHKRILLSSISTLQFHRIYHFDTILYKYPHLKNALLHCHVLANLQMHRYKLTFQFLKCLCRA